MKYRKKPVTIDAFQFDGTVECLINNIHQDDWDLFAFTYAKKTTYEVGRVPLSIGIKRQLQDYAEQFYIATLEGAHNLITGDYVIKGVHGEYYPCKPYIFEETYNKVDDTKQVQLPISDWHDIRILLLNKAEEYEKVKNMNADNCADYVRDVASKIDDQLKSQDKE